MKEARTSEAFLKGKFCHQWKERMHVAGNIDGLSMEVSSLITFLVIIEVCEQY
jgi:hypothetical protein